MKIVLVGALRFSNFGDILFAKLFYERICSRYKDATVLLYETAVNRVSSFCRNELNYQNQFHFSDFKDADILVYMSGGYFSNSFEKPVTRALWHIRYALPGNIFSSKNRDIYILGIGGGEFSSPLSAKNIKKIIDKSKYVSVRNPETAMKFKQLGTKADIHINTDTALVVSKRRELYCGKSKEGEKKIFVHIIPIRHYYSLLREKVLPAIKQFLIFHSEYEIVVGYDSAVKDKYNKYLYDTVEYFGDSRATINKYETVNGLMNILGECNIVITPKLHVGIVSSAFGKSVFSFPINYEKTYRYYKSIGYPERCSDIYTIEKKHVLSLLNQYWNIGIEIPMSLVKLAEENLTVCDGFNQL